MFCIQKIGSRLGAPSFCTMLEKLASNVHYRHSQFHQGTALRVTTPGWHSFVFQGAVVYRWQRHLLRHWHPTRCTLQRVGRMLRPNHCIIWERCYSDRKPSKLSWLLISSYYYVVISMLWNKRHIPTWVWPTVAIVCSVVAPMLVGKYAGLHNPCMLVCRVCARA